MIPLGYQRIGDKLVPDGGEQFLVRQILDMRASGLSYGAIAARLNERGSKGKEGGAFYASTISKICNNDLHAA